MNAILDLFKFNCTVLARARSFSPHPTPPLTHIHACKQISITHGITLKRN